MLIKLLIKNIALIENAEIEFSNGLNVLSGETGSGKSVILESLNFVLGAKADRTLIRFGAEFCSVTAEFDVGGNYDIQSLFEQMDIEKDDSLIITRKFTAEGKNSIKINGQTVTVSMLRAFSSKLVDVHGQSEHYELLSVANQLKLIDKLCGDKMIELKSTSKDLSLKYKNVINNLEQFGGDEAQRLVRLDVLNFQINEIEQSNIFEGEFEKLQEIRSQLQNREKISSALNSIKESFSGDGGVSDVVSNALRVANGINGLSDKFLALSEEIDNAYSIIDNISDTVNTFLSDFEELDYNPDEIEARIDLIKSLRRKYGQDYSQIMSFLDDARAEKNKLENFEENCKKLLLEKRTLEEDIYNTFSLISNLRKQESLSFSQNVINELCELGMTKANFAVEFDNPPSREDCVYTNYNGFDVVKFMFSANSGQPLKPLSDIISGGEMSRFMLALKAQTAKANEISTFVFDEIDAGISGVVAQVVAKKFANISKNVQVIAITHLPQISSMADNNLLIQKAETAEQTITTVTCLSPNDKVKEIMRLVGDSSSESARSLAIELIDNAEKYKKSIM